MLWFSNKKDYNNFEKQHKQQIHIYIRIYVYECISILFITFPLNSFSLRTNEKGIIQKDSNMKIKDAFLTS